MNFLLLLNGSWNMKNFYILAPRSEKHSGNCSLSLKNISAANLCGNEDLNSCFNSDRMGMYEVFQL